MKKLTLDIDGRSVQGTVAVARGTVWVHLDGETFALEMGRKKRAGGKGAAAKPGEITAPMPGKIIKILVQKGQAVSAGETLLVMEAMKMEYTLKAHAAGQVLEVFCEPGQQVALGQSLVKTDAG